MGNIFSGIGDLLKKGFFVLTALAIAGLNLLMLLDVFSGDILFVILGMVFFSVATWVYMVTAFAASEKTSGFQTVLAWIGLGISLVGELSMASFEIMRVQSFISPPPWINTVTIVVIEVAIIFHLLLGIAYFAASSDYNEKLNRLHEASRRRDVAEKLRTLRAKAEIKVEEDATDEGLKLTRSMLFAALPVLAERKARQTAGELARTFGMDADPELIQAFEQAISEYRHGFTTAALGSGSQSQSDLVIQNESNIAKRSGGFIGGPLPPAPTTYEAEVNPTNPAKPGKK